MTNTVQYDWGMMPPVTPYAPGEKSMRQSDLLLHITVPSVPMLPTTFEILNQLSEQGGAFMGRL